MVQKVITTNCPQHFFYLHNSFKRRPAGWKTVQSGNTELLSKNPEHPAALLSGDHVKGVTMHLYCQWFSNISCLDTCFSFNLCQESVKPRTLHVVLLSDPNHESCVRFFQFQKRSVFHLLVPLPVWEPLAQTLRVWLIILLHTNIDSNTCNSTHITGISNETEPTC